MLPLLLLLDIQVVMAAPPKKGLPLRMAMLLRLTTVRPHEHIERVIVGICMAIQ